MFFSIAVVFSNIKGKKAGVEVCCGNTYYSDTYKVIVVERLSFLHA